MRAGIPTCLKSHDGINAFNTLDHEVMEPLFKKDGEVAKDQNMNHSTYLMGSEETALLKPTVGTLQGGPKATHRSPVHVVAWVGA